MPITTNSGGVLHNLSPIYARNGAVLNELSTIYARNGGVLSTIYEKDSGGGGGGGDIPTPPSETKTINVHWTGASTSTVIAQFTVNSPVSVTFRKTSNDDIENLCPRPETFPTSIHPNATKFRIYYYYSYSCDIKMSNDISAKSYGRFFVNRKPLYRRIRDIKTGYWIEECEWDYANLYRDTVITEPINLNEGTYYVHYNVKLIRRIDPSNDSLNSSMSPGDREDILSTTGMSADITLTLTN